MNMENKRKGGRITSGVYRNNKDNTTEGMDCINETSTSIGIVSQSSEWKTTPLYRNRKKNSS